VYSIQELSLLRPWHGLAFVRGARPVEVKVKPVWEYRGYVPAQVAGQAPELEVAPGPVRIPGGERRPELERGEVA